MNSFLKGLAGLAVLCVVVTSALGQQRVGTVEGVVLDQSGAALPGATLTLAGENLMGQRVVVSGPGGEFRFVLVPPGLYQLEVRLEGFQPFEEREVRVGLGSATTVEITMVAAFEEAVKVVADQVLVDAKSNKVGDNLLGDFVGKLATDRQYQSVISMLPGVLEATYNPRVHGGSGSDNMYFVDGADATDALEQKSAVAMNFDNFQEIQVITGGVPAEYGRGTGGVVNLITKSGSNEFHGTARYTYADVDLNSKLRGDRFAFDDETRYISEKRPSANLGGPIFRDKLWFFTSYEKRDKVKPTTFFRAPEDAVAGLYSHSKTSYGGHYATGKLTYAPNVSHTIFAQYAEDPVETPFIYAYRGETTRAPESDNTLVEGGDSGTVDWTGVLSDSVFVTLQYAYNSKHFDYLPYDTTGTTNYSGAGGGIYWNAAYREYYTIKDKDVFSFSYNQFVDSGGAGHELKAGLEYAKYDVGRYGENYINDQGPAGTYVRYKNDGVTPDYEYVYIQRNGMVRTPKTISSLYVQDSWRVNPKLTLNLGVRLERYIDKSNAGEAVLDWGWSDRIQPRLGMAYALRNGGVIRGFIGRYHDEVGSAYARAFSNSPDQIRDRYNWNATSQQWTFYRRYVTGAALRTRDNLKSPYMDELLAAYEAKISGSMAWSVTAVYREWRDGLENEDGRDVPGNPAADGNNNYTNVDKVRTYGGIEFALRKMLAGDRLQFMASYTYSRAKGIWGSGEDDEISEDYGATPYSYWNQWGYVEQDRPHSLKFNGSYYLPYDFLVGASFSYWSGRPYTVVGSVKTSTAGQWEGVTFSGYHIKPTGSDRLPSLWRLDLHLERTFRMGPVAAGLVMDVFNVTNNQEATDIDSNVGTITLQNDEPGAAYTVVDPNSRFGKYTVWQAPRSYFFGVKLEF
jgi:outer membrane receptor protein involved in Fe transport